MFAQGLKPFTAAVAGQGFNWKLAFKSGGMPSSHSALVTSLATALGIERGATDPVFGAFTVYACIVMYDAQGVRRAVGKQAEVLNTLVVPDLAQRSLGVRTRTSHGQEAPSSSPPAASSIGMELAQEARKAELDFVQNGVTRAEQQPAQADGFAGNSAPIGAELAKEGAHAELAFMDGREDSQGQISSDGKSAETAMAASSVGLLARSSPESSPSSFPGSGMVGSQDHAHRSSASSGGTNKHTDGVLNHGTANNSKPFRAAALEKVKASVPLNRSKEFWAAAAQEPSMQEGEVVLQELGQMEGWRHIPLKESVGHTKPQVLAGAVAGIVLALLLDTIGFYS